MQNANYIALNVLALQSLNYIPVGLGEIQLAQVG